MHYKVQGFMGPVAPLASNIAASPLVVGSQPQLTSFPAGQPGVVYGKPEPAVKHVYDYRSRKWTRENITVQISAKPFQEGTLRIIFHMVDMSTNQSVVAKISKEPNEPSQTYFLDVEMQGYAKKYAELYNAQKPPKPIDFVLPYVVELHRTNPMGRKIFLGVEPFLHGKYQKHSNNYGFVSHEDRNTPQAFSHFTYQISMGKYLVCDIQGVGDMYTDPQIHCSTKRGRFGKADMGIEGVRKFFETHRCNAICEFLNLTVSGRKKEFGLPAGVKDDASKIHGMLAHSPSIMTSNGLMMKAPTASSQQSIVSIPASMTSSMSQQMISLKTHSSMQMVRPVVMIS